MANMAKAADVRPARQVVDAAGARDRWVAARPPRHLTTEHEREHCRPLDEPPRNATAEVADSKLMGRRFREAAARARWYEFTPEAALLLGLGVFALIEPSAAAAGLRSRKAIGLMLAVGVAWAAGRTVLFV